MEARKATLVLSGGGAKGAFQVGAEQVLREEGGFQWERVFGVSAGALNAALVAQGEYARLREVWDTIREGDVYDQAGWLTVAWRLALLKKTGLYDHTALRRTIEKHAAGRPFRIPLHVGRVSLVSGRYELVSSDSPEILDAVWHSASMPVIWEVVGPQAFADGGLRNVTPLGDALDFNPTELVVVVTSPEAIAPAPPPADIAAAAIRSLTDITIHEIMVDDVRQFVRINGLVQQAAAQGALLFRDDGTPYRYFPISVIQPDSSLGDVLDFSREAIRDRIEAGRRAASALLHP